MKERSKINSYFQSLGSALIGTGGLGGMGYIVGRSTGNNHYIVLLLLVFFMLFSAYMAAKFLYRFFFMKANLAFVKYHPLSNKKKKKLRKKGIELK